MRRKTHTEFVAQVQKKNPTLEVISEYTTMSSNITYRCMKCGDTSTVRAASFARGTHCKHCKNLKMMKTQSEFEQKVQDVHGTKLSVMENDELKKSLAIQNNYTYIALDCRESNFSFIKKSVLNSELPKLINLHNLDWSKCQQLTMEPTLLRVARLWNSGNRVCEIANIEHLSRTTIREYLKDASNARLCEYGT